METINFRPKFMREETDLQEPPRRYFEPNEIKLKLYVRECEKLRVIPISAYLRQTNNKSLRIKYYNIGPNGAKALAAAVMLDNTLSHLDIEGNSITTVGLASIKEALIGHNFVTYLNIGDNKLGSHGAKLLGLLMKENHKIATLIASKNGFKDVDAKVFADIIRENRTLKELNLSGNEFEEHAGVDLGHALTANESLEVLDVSWNNIRKRGAVEFAHGIKENVGLKRLNVSFNGFGTEGAACMGQSLATNRTLLELDLSKNRITNIDVKVLAKQLKSNDTLEVLKIGDNLIDALGAIDILEAVMALEASSMKLIDFGTTCVDQGFLQVYEELKSLRPFMKVRHGRIQNFYINPDMKPPQEYSDQASTECSSKTPLSEIIKEEKGKTYVISSDESQVTKDKTQNAESDAKANTNDNAEINDLPAPEFDDQKLDDEVSAVTGKPTEEDKVDQIQKVDQKPLVDGRASAGTFTPDI